MIEEPPKLTVRKAARRPTEAQLAAFRGQPTGFVFDAAGGGALDAAIGPSGAVAPGCRIAGPALTAGNGPGDIMATLAALAFLRPGDVLVAAASGYQGCAAAGDRVCAMARNAGAVALVTDGPLRDMDGLRTVGLPAWCTGLTPASPFTTGPGTVGLPVEIGGQRVETGDMVVADDDGVVVVPFAAIETVAARLQRVAELETSLDAEVAAGLAVPDAVRDWLADPAVTLTLPD